MAVLISQPKFQRIALAAAVFIIGTYFLLERADRVPYQASWSYVPTSFDWASRQPRYPIAEELITRLPEGKPRDLPHIQHAFTPEELNEAHNRTQAERRNAIKDAAVKTWTAYRDYAWGKDQLMPQSLRGVDSFNGWGATLVDSLDSLWIMDMKKEFHQAVRMVSKIDWAKTTSRDCNVFETTIRYLGGLLSAYDLSGETVLLKKAEELGEMLFAAFDTPNNLPANSLNFRAVEEGLLYASKREALAAVGTLSMEFTRLSQLTGNHKFFSVIDTIKNHLERTQDETKLPGMWPMYIDLRNNFIAEDNAFTLDAMSDSAYEYLSKMYALLGGLDETYKRLHVKAMATIKQHLLFRPMLPEAYPATPPDILFSGTVLSNGRLIELLPDVQHLACFTGAMFAVGGRLFHSEEDVKIGERLARGCAWAYEAFPTGIMPEISTVMPCPKTAELAQCEWNQTAWRERNTTPAGMQRAQLMLPKPFTAMRDKQYLLRPEAIESVFVLYRITGKPDLLDVAWRMFQAVKAATETKFAFSAIVDVDVDGATTKVDAMESYWMAETLKYYYLIFSEPDLISLDDYVFNTEAHPFKLPKASGGRR